MENPDALFGANNNRISIIIHQHDSCHMLSAISSLDFTSCTKHPSIYHHVTTWHLPSACSHIISGLHLLHEALHRNTSWYVVCDKLPPDWRNNRISIVILFLCGFMYAFMLPKCSRSITLRWGKTGSDSFELKQDPNEETKTIVQRTQHFTHSASFFQQAKVHAFIITCQNTLSLMLAYLTLMHYRSPVNATCYAK